MEYKYKVFISYRRDDTVFKDTVYYILSEYIDEERIFVDTVELNKRPNKWFETIHDALLSSEYILICVNKDTFNRESQDNKTDWYYKEIEIALQRQKEDNSIHIIPIINIRPNFRETRFPELSQFQDVSYRTKSEKTTFKERLLKILGIEDKHIGKNSSYPTKIKNIVFPYNLVPRFDMLNKVWKSFYDHNCVVVSGIGGSGKTSLAYMYAKEQNFNNIAWITVNGKIEDAFLEKMAELLFEGEELERFMQNQNKQGKLAIIKKELSNIKGKNLLVLDVNANNENIKQEINTQIYKYLPSDNWKTLVLTRAYVKNKNRFVFIVMDKMTGEEAKELFLNNYDGCIQFSDDQLDIIVNELYYHPLLIEQTAIAFSSSQVKDADEVLNNIKGNKVKNKRTEEILGGLATEEKEIQDIYTYLINLCKIENLSDDEVKLLACYVTWPNEPIDYEVIETLLPNNEVTLKTLTEKGIISHNEQYSIHNLMADVLREQLKISEFDYTEYFNNIQIILNDDVKKASLHKFSTCIASSFITYGICGDVDLFLKFLTELLNIDDSILYNLITPAYYIVIKKMEQKSNPQQLALLYNIEARIEKCNSKFSESKSHYNQGITILKSLDRSDNNLDLLSLLLSNLAVLEEDIIKDLNSAKKHKEEALHIRQQLPDTPSNLHEMAIVLNNLAFLEKKISLFDAALKHYNEVLNIRSYKMNPTPYNLQEKAKTLNNLAKLEAQLFHYENAKKHYNEALNILNQISENPEMLNIKAWLLNNFAMLEMILNYKSSAKAHLEIAIAIRNNKLPQNHDNLQKKATTVRNLADLEASLGDTDSAQKHYEEGLKIARKIKNDEYIKFFEDRLNNT